MKEPTDSRPLIVHIVYSLGTGGLENGLVNIINRCPMDRYRHAIVCLTHATEFAARITHPGVQIFELHKRSGHDLAMYWRLWKVLRSLRPSIVHTRNIAAFETHVLGLLMPKTRRVQGEHGRDVQDIDGSNSRFRLLRRLLEPLVHRFITVSVDLERWLVDDVGIPEKKVVQIYNGVDHEKFSESQSSSTMVRDQIAGGPAAVLIGTVGRLAAVKDQQLILRALHRTFARQNSLRDRVRCIFVGAGPERAALETQARELGLADEVHFAGDRSDVPAWLGAMDVFLLPSLGEGVSNTILEAMSARLPVIATRVGGNPELVVHGETGFLVPVGDEEILADRILELVVDSALRDQMGKAGQALVRTRFDWAKTVANYLDVYDELLAR